MFLFLLLFGYAHVLEATDTLEDPCSLPVEKGPCMQSLFRYYYDPAIDDCKRFIYSGCGGNSNRFTRRQLCRNKCNKGSSPRTEPTVPTTEARTQSAGHFTSTANFALKTKKPKKCPICDPLYGKCVEGECTCIQGFRLHGRICVDIDECQLPGTCPEHANCTNTFGSYKCNCPDDKCDQASAACKEPFDPKLGESCDNIARKEKRFYFDALSGSCKEFLYAGCSSTSRNQFFDLHSCEKACDVKVKQMFKNYGTTEAPPAAIASSTADSTVVQMAESTRETTPSNEILAPFHENDICNKDFDAVLRLECIEASWIEKFYWRADIKDCEPFWYDSTCDPKDSEDKNIFDSLHECTAKCKSPKHTKHIPQISIQASESTNKPMVLPGFRYQVNEPTRSAQFLTLPTEALHTAPSSWIARPDDVPQKPPKLITTPPDEPPPEDDDDDEEKEDSCLEALDSKLEEDCKGDVWEIRWYFNSEKRSCKRFWYGGCVSAARNYFKSAKECKATCGHHYRSRTRFGSDFGSRSETKSEETVRPPSERPTTELPVPEDPTPSQPHTSAPTKTQPTSTTEPPTTTDEIQLNHDYQKSIEGQTFPPIVDPTTPAETTEAATTTASTRFDITKKKLGIYDPCKDAYDPKFEEDCSEDNWVPRSYFNQDKMDCVRFWYGGCSSESQNLFADQKSCRLACAQHIATSRPPVDSAHNWG